MQAAEQPKLALAIAALNINLFRVSKKLKIVPIPRRVSTGGEAQISYSIFGIERVTSCSSDWLLAVASNFYFGGSRDF